MASVQFFAKVAIIELSVAIMFLSFILIQFIAIFRSHRETRSLVLSMATIVAGMIVALTLSAIGEFYWLDPTLVSEQDSFFMSGFAMYFAGWLLGLSKFTNEIIRLPENRKAQFQYFNRILSFLVVISIVGIYFALAFPLIQFNSVRLVSLSFIIISSIASFGFFFYYRVLGREIDKNASKLIKARLQLIRYAIQIQLFLLLAVILGVSAIILGARDIVAETLTFGLASIIMSVCGLIFRWVIYIPNRIRMRFNLTATRFKYIQKMIAKP